MDDPDIALVLTNSAAFSARDVEAMLACYHPEAKVIDQRRVSMGSFTGHAELRAYYRGIIESTARMHERLEVVAAGGGEVVTQCELSGTLATDPNGAEVSVEYGLLVTIEDGLIVRLDLCEDAEHALELSSLDAG